MIRVFKLHGVRIQGFRSIGGDVRNGHFGNHTPWIADPVIDPLDVCAVAGLPKEVGETKPFDNSDDLDEDDGGTIELDIIVEVN